MNRHPKNKQQPTKTKLTVTSVMLSTLASLSVSSCFPAKQSTSPEVIIKVIDKETGKPVTNGRIKCTQLQPTQGSSASIPSTPSVLEIEKETIIQKGETAFGIFWVMQQPLTGALKVQIDAPSYISKEQTITTFTHGAFGPFTIEETIELNPR